MSRCSATRKKRWPGLTADHSHGFGTQRTSTASVLFLRYSMNERFLHIRRLAVAATLIACGVVSVSCGRDDRLELLVRHNAPPEQPQHRTLLHVADLLSERTGGQIILTVQPSISIVDHEEVILEGLRDIAMASLAGLSRFYPPLGAFEAPYMFRSVDHFYATVDSDVGQRIRREFEARSGFHVLDIWHQGYRHVTLVDTPARTPEEFSSVRLRVPSNIMFVEAARILGAQPISASFENVAVGLRSGMFDGQENPLPTIAAMEFDRLSNYLVLTSHVLSTITPIMSKQHWESLSCRDQQIIEQTFRDGRVYNREIIEADENRLIDEFADAGLEIIRPDLGVFRERARGSWRKYEELWGASLVDEIQAVE